MSCPNWIYATAGTRGVAIRRVFQYASGSINIQYRRTLNKINPGSYFILRGISDSSSRSELNLRSLAEATLGRQEAGQRPDFVSDGCNHGACGGPGTAQLSTGAPFSCILLLSLQQGLPFSCTCVCPLTVRSHLLANVLETGAFRPTKRRSGVKKPHVKQKEPLMTSTLE